MNISPGSWTEMIGNHGLYRQNGVYDVSHLYQIKTIDGLKTGKIGFS